MTYTQSNCITRHMTNRSEAPFTHTEQSLAHPTAHVESARAGCSMEGGLRVQGLVVQRREV